ncbi:methyl-accepting chemotaxis protein, partial [Shewanella frigidimarina]
MSVLIEQLDREDLRQSNHSQANVVSAFKSVRFQLKLIVFLTVISFLFLGYKGISGMQDAGDSIG